jgi:hypothetical protein
VTKEMYAFSLRCLIRSLGACATVVWGRLAPHRAMPRIAKVDEWRSAQGAEWSEAAGRPWRVYRLTAGGRRALGEKARAWRHFARGMSGALEGAT